MFVEPMLSLDPLHEAHIDPHWFLNSRFTNMHHEGTRQIIRSVLPCRKRWSPSLLRIARTQTNTKRRSVAVPSRPSFPKQGGPRALILSRTWITHPEQLDHRICQSKTTTSGTLPRVLIWGCLKQTELDKFFSLWSPGSRADE